MRRRVRGSNYILKPCGCEKGYRCCCNQIETQTVDDCVTRLKRNKNQLSSIFDSMPENGR